MYRSYSELSKISDFLDRYDYLRIGGKVGEETFGYDRYFNQLFYSSFEWKSVRDFVIVRDFGCDLGVEGYDIRGKIYIHHMNPVTLDGVKRRSEILLDPEFLITTTFRTHQAIHYSNENLLIVPSKERTRNDTCPWKR